MKLLLLTDIPPNRSFTAGLVLDRLCRFLPEGSVACFAVVNPEIDVSLSADLPGVSVHYVDKPRERALAGARRSFLIGAAERLRGLYDRHLATPHLIEEAAAFARREKVDAVWAVLQGQTCIQMAEPLARQLGVPLFTLVWDPLSWWLQSNGTDEATNRATRAAFDRAISASRAVATASWAMTEEYDRTYRVFSVPVIASHDRAVAQRPEPRLQRDGELTIGMAGQFYARDAWDDLLTALNAAGWSVRGRQVRILVAGHSAPPGEAPAGRVQTLGWLSHAELVRRMSECDLTFCPYPFDPALDEVSRLSFPSKVVAYLAAGRPVVFHGPRTASPARYLVQTGAGVVSYGPKAAAVFNVIDQLVRDPELYRSCAEGAVRAFERDFTLETMRENFYSFLRTRPDDLQGAGEKAPVTVRDARSAAVRRRRLKQRGPSLAGRLLAISPGFRALRREHGELAEWKRVHAKELDGLYRYAAELNAEIARLRGAGAGERSAAGPRQSEEGAALLEAIAMRDARLADALEQEQLLRARVEALGSTQASLQETMAALERDLQEARDRAVSSGALAHALRNAADESEEALRDTQERLQEVREARTLLAARLAEARAKVQRLEEELRAGREQTQLELALLREQLAAAQRYGADREAALALVAQEREAALALVAQEREAALGMFAQERDARLGKLAEERDAALSRLYHEGVSINRRSAEMEVRVGELKAVNELQMARILGKLTNVEAAAARLVEAAPASKSGGHSNMLYLDLVEAALIGALERDPCMKDGAFRPELREVGRDRPSRALTMIGRARMRNIRRLALDVIDRGVPGDFLEAGVWRGGACIYMRAILKACNQNKRKVWVADSFQGLPPPDPEAYPSDAGDIHHTYQELAVSLAQVQTSFDAYGLLDDQVAFLPGWFKDTMPKADINRLALLRLDGDMYGSTMEVLEAMYHKVSPGGFVVIDDFDLLPCRKAVEDFRAREGIEDPVVDVDGAAVYWRKSGEAAIGAGAAVDAARVRA